ncbi:MAG: hypothetical protein Q9M14_01830 [Mariprofundaceae bacterium]|nr:hypothetical protein [Mariprofundaceae bacterium]
MQASDQAPLSIARHAIQFIWQTSLSANNNKIIGLLGSQIKGEIDNATHTPLWPASPSPTAQDVIQLTHTQSPLTSLKEISQTWQDNHIFLSGVYQCASPTINAMQSTEKELRSYFKQHDGIPFIHLNISFNTKGVLESEAWIIKNNQAIQIPMLLTEDGQAAAKS